MSCNCNYIVDTGVLFEMTESAEARNELTDSTEPDALSVLLIKWLGLTSLTPCCFGLCSSGGVDCGRTGTGAVRKVLQSRLVIRIKLYS